MKDDKSGFWKAICKDPDDDVPRLVFADYLDEQGQPERAELIRAQCDVEALPLSDPQRIDREMTAERLLRQNRFEWVEELPKWIQRSTVIFRRGFPYSIWATPSEYARSCSSLAKSTVIQQVDGFSNPFTDAHREKIEKSGHLPRVRGYARPQATRPELEWMLTHATGLKELSLFSPRGHGSDPSWL